MKTLTELATLVAADSRSPDGLLWWLERQPRHVTTALMWSGQGAVYQGIPRPDWMVYLAMLCKRPLPPHLVTEAYDATEQIGRRMWTGSHAQFPLIDCVDRIRGEVSARVVFS